MSGYFLPLLPVHILVKTIYTHSLFSHNIFLFLLIPFLSILCRSTLGLYCLKCTVLKFSLFKRTVLIFFSCVRNFQAFLIYCNVRTSLSSGPFTVFLFKLIYSSLFRRTVVIFFKFFICQEFTIIEP